MNSAIWLVPIELPIESPIELPIAMKFGAVTDNLLSYVS